MTERDAVLNRLCVAVAGAPCGRDAAWEATLSALLDEGAVSVAALERCAARLEWVAGCARGRSDDGGEGEWSLAACS
ncbi:hypothetical protein [Arhodomonas sp. AD133]|uniref:hypothetical protein n=1 Tax=Arhodomonas sp. AD133 TaxID=3415009 RepID=UPI003EBD6DDB